MYTLQSILSCYSIVFILSYIVFVATDDTQSYEVPSRRRTIKPPAWQKDYYMF